MTSSCYKAKNAFFITNSPLQLQLLMSRHLLPLFFLLVSMVIAAQADCASSLTANTVFQVAQTGPNGNFASGPISLSSIQPCGTLGLTCFSGTTTLAHPGGTGSPESIIGTFIGSNISFKRFIADGETQIFYGTCESSAGSFINGWWYYGEVASLSNNGIFTISP